MPNLIDSAEFTANEILELQQTDLVEAAATGASYGGIGRSNQQAQQLANRTAFLKGRQDTNIANITALQAFQALFTGKMAGTGYVKIPFVDVSRGLITAVVQWGTIIYNTKLSSGDIAQVVGWPISFPNAFEICACWALRDPALTANDSNDWGVEFVSGTTTQGTFELDAFSSGVTPYGWGYLAIGF